MKILFVASECSPIAKVGGLADVIGALPKALKNLGIDVRICLPKYQVIDCKKYKFELIAKDIIVKNEKINIYQGFLPGSQVIIYLLENEKYFGQNEIYFGKTAFVDSFKEIQRFLFFSLAVLEIFPAIDWFPQIVHCHDWHTAILPALAKLKIRNPKSKIRNLLTIHNLANQGKYDAQEIFNFLALRNNERASFSGLDKDGNFNILQQGILHADTLNTVSENYSREVLTEDYGYGLEDSLLKRKDVLCGILNGIDLELFNPAADPQIEANYSLKNFDKKNKNKIDLQKKINLPSSEEIPLFGNIGRLTFQKGIDLILEFIPDLVKFNCQLIILGVGEEQYEKKLLDLSKKYPKNLSVQIKFDPILAQKIYAGCDIFLMPSLFEPCGLGQMIAMRYGTIPIVRKTGGLADTVEEEKTGFLFEKYDYRAFLESIKRALQNYQNKKKWKSLIKNTMSKDFSWQKSAKAYFKLYQELISLD